MERCVKILILFSSVLKLNDLKKHLFGPRACAVCLLRLYVYSYSTFNVKICQYSVISSNQIFTI